MQQIWVLSLLLLRVSAYSIQQPLCINNCCCLPNTCSNNCQPPKGCYNCVQEQLIQPTPNNKCVCTETSTVYPTEVETVQECTDCQPETLPEKMVKPIIQKPVPTESSDCIDCYQQQQQQQPMYQQHPMFQQQPMFQQHPMFQQQPTLQQHPMFQQQPTLQQHPMFQQQPTLQQQPMFQQPMHQQEPTFQQQQITFQQHQPMLQQMSFPTYQQSSGYTPIGFQAVCHPICFGNIPCCNYWGYKNPYSAGK